MTHGPGGDYTMMEWTPERLERFWSFEGAHPERYFTFHHADLIVDMIIRKVDLFDRALDYGCGCGHLLEEFMTRGIPVTGLDNSRASIERLREQFDGSQMPVACHVADDAPRNSSWPLVTCIEVLEHLDDDALEKAVSTMHLLLERGGHLFVTTPNEEVLEESFVMNPDTGEVFHRWQHVRSWSVKTLTDYLSARGFSPVSVEATWIRREPPADFLRKIKRALIPPRPSTHTPHLVGVFRKD